MSVDNEYASVHIVEYDTNTGAITTSGVLNIRQVIDILATKSNWLIGQGSLDGHYVDLSTREIRLRGPFPAALNGSTLTGMPVPSQLSWQHESGSSDVIGVTDSTVDLDFSVLGKYRVTLEAVAYLPVTFDVQVSPPAVVEAPE